MLKNIIKVSQEVFKHMGGLNFDEKDFQLAFGYELTSLKIDYMREISLEIYYKDIPIKLGSPDFFLNSKKPPVIIELKLSSSIQNSHRQQLKMYLVAIKRTPKSVISKVKYGIIINFLKEDVKVSEHTSKKSKKNNIEIEYYEISKDERLILIEKVCL
tara:strand:- start:108 stop:581 length:474 start_codon:yes stop_codon:yes gene_type:complete